MTTAEFHPILMGMTEQTKSILRTILASDPDTKERIDEILDFAEHGEGFPEHPTASRDALNDRGRLLSGKEVARMLNRTPMTIRRWANEGKLTSAKVRGSSRRNGYFEKDVLAFIDTARATA